MARTLGIVGAGLLMVAALAQLVRKGPSIVLDGEGIHEHRSGFGTIPWADIVSLRIGALKRTRFLCVEVRDPGLFLSRLPLHRRLLARANRMLGFPPVAISFAGLEPGLDEAGRHLQAAHPEKIA